MTGPITQFHPGMVPLPQSLRPASLHGTGAFYRYTSLWVNSKNPCARCLNLLPLAGCWRGKDGVTGIVNRSIETQDGSGQRVVSSVSMLNAVYCAACFDAILAVQPAQHGDEAMVRWVQQQHDELNPAYEAPLNLFPIETDTTEPNIPNLSGALAKGLPTFKDPPKKRAKAKGQAT